MEKTWLCKETGMYQRPKGKAPPGQKWDYMKGCWAPSASVPQISPDCHVCYDPILDILKQGHQVIRCCNGHSCCEKHHLERIRAMYQSDQMAFGGEDDDDSGMGQTCFECRVKMPDQKFSRKFMVMLNFIQAVEIPKLMARTRGMLPQGHQGEWTPHDAVDFMRQTGSQRHIDESHPE
jgi:hypothetical protein